ncbi:unnamed protein product [Chrysoparadoxa australica]
MGGEDGIRFGGWKRAIASLSLGKPPDKGRGTARGSHRHSRYHAGQSRRYHGAHDTATYKRQRPEKSMRDKSTRLQSNCLKEVVTKTRPVASPAIDDPRVLPFWPQNAHKTIAQHLQAVSVFTEATPQEINFMAQKARHLVVKPGEFVVVEGSNIQCPALYIIASGTAAVSVSTGKAGCNTIKLTQSQSHIVMLLPEI